MVADVLTFFPTLPLKFVGDMTNPGLKPVTNFHLYITLVQL
jgi:hypothetical protein